MLEIEVATHEDYHKYRFEYIEDNELIKDIKRQETNKQYGRIQ